MRVDTERGPSTCAAIDRDVASTEGIEELVEVGSNVITAG